MTTFSLQLNEFAAKFDANADQIVRKVAIEALSRLVKRSPVDTGRFRANWNASIGSADISVAEKFDKAGAETIAEGANRLSAFKVGPSIWITNSLAYAERLENGYSRQAPAGMVRLTSVEFQDFVRDTLKELNE